MARTRKVKDQKNIVFWLIMIVLTAFIIFATLTKMGPVGSALHRILSFMLSEFYVVPLLLLFSYSIYYVIFKGKYDLNAALETAIILVVVGVVILCAFLQKNFSSLNEYGRYIVDGIRSLFNSADFAYGGGLLGNLLFVLISMALGESGAFWVLILIFVIAVILFASLFDIKKTYDDTRKKIEDKKEEIRRQRAIEREKQAKLLEEKRLKLAEEFNSDPIVEESVLIDDTPLIKEEKTEKPKPKKTSHPEVLSKKSKFFINLDEEEVKADVVKEEVKNEEEILKEPVKVLQVKKKSSTYHLPPMSLLEPADNKTSNINRNSAEVKGQKVVEILDKFGIPASLVETHIGPSVTKFEIKPDSSVKVNRIMNIADNLKMELAAKDIRIEAPIPGRNAVGIEIPNVETNTVKLKELMQSMNSKVKPSAKLSFALGKDLMGDGVYCDLSRMPHLLIAGATGSGKSVCINTIITSYLMRCNPDDVKLVLIDPKKVEFTPYNDIPHLLWPVITEAEMASNMLKKAVVIMEERYDAFAVAKVRNIQTYNELVDKHNAELKEDETPMTKMPYIVIIIDELADLMAIAKKDVELSIQRITQLARASGIHLIVATQRPSTDVITGIIKSNIPSRISFAVASSIDSRTILDQIGAERLLGNGDMLYYPQGESSAKRLQGVYVSDNEISKITDYAKKQASPEYEDSYFEFLTNMNGTTVASASAVNASEEDSLYNEVLEYIRETQKASTSLLQRRFGIGYNRAARLIDTLEDRGMIGPAQGSKPREVYIKKDDGDE